MDENKDAIEAYETYMRRKDGGGDDYGEEGEEEEVEVKPTEAPVLPLFDEKEFLEKWDEENPEIKIADVTEDDKDNDWLLAPEEKEDILKKAVGSGDN